MSIETTLACLLVHSGLEHRHIRAVQVPLELYVVRHALVPQSCEGAVCASRLDGAKARPALRVTAQTVAEASEESSPLEEGGEQLDGVLDDHGLSGGGDHFLLDVDLGDLLLGLAAPLLQEHDG